MKIEESRNFVLQKCVNCDKLVSVLLDVYSCYCRMWIWFQINTDLLLIVTSTADKLYGGTNIYDLER